VAGKHLSDHNVWTDWASESVKASLDPRDSTASFEVPFKQPYSSIQTRWKQTFYTTNVGKDLTFAMMIKKVETFLVGDPRGQRPRILFFLSWSHFAASQHPRTPPNLQKMCIWVLYNIPPNFKPNYWEEILFVKKIKISTRWLSRFLGIFLPITPQSLRLVGWSRYLKLQNSF